MPRERTGASVGKKKVPDDGPGAGGRFGLSGRVSEKFHDMGVEEMKIRLLIVDDEKDFTDSLAERLSLRGFDVTTAYGGEEAVQRIGEYNYDVVILDVAMPGMDGIQTLREIKNRKPLTEVIMLTGHATVETAIEGMKLGAYDYLLKPVHIDGLVEKVRAAHARKADHEERIRMAKMRRYFESPRAALDDEEP